MWQPINVLQALFIHFFAPTNRLEREEHQKRAPGRVPHWLAGQEPSQR
jgi:hypothetical protein